MLDYIVNDFDKSRIATNENTIGGMVICDSYEQAETMYKTFIDKYSSNTSNNEKVKAAKLILHDVGSKDDRDEFVEDFKIGKIDFLFVFNMLLTGFDSPRLKKYILVVKSDHTISYKH